MQHLFETPAMIIGKHEWRIIVIPSRYSGYCTLYEFRRIGGNYWKSQHDWPGYNINDGMYLGMPKSITRLYDCNKDDIKAAIEGQPSPQHSLEV